MINLPEVDTVLPTDPEAPSSAHANRSPWTALARHSPPHPSASKRVKLVCRPGAKASPPRPPLLIRPRNEHLIPLGHQRLLGAKSAPCRRTDPQARRRQRCPLLRLWHCEAVIAGVSGCERATCLVMQPSIIGDLVLLLRVVPAGAKVEARCGSARGGSLARSSRARGSPRVKRVSVLLAPLAVAGWPGVRPGARRLPAYKCSHGRRPSGSDSEATDPLAAPLQRHRSAVGGRLTRPRLQHACQLQRPCSLPCVRASRA